MNIMIFDGTFQYDAASFFSAELGNALKELNHQVQYVNVAKCSAQVIKEKIIKNNIELILTFNGITNIVQTELEALNVIVGVLLLDHPFYHITRMHDWNRNNVFICMYDTVFLESTENYINKEIPIAHWFHGGKGAEYIPLEKEYDVIMCGTIIEIPKREELFNGLNEGVLKQIALAVYDRGMENTDIVLDDLLDEELKRRGIVPEFFRQKEANQMVLASIYTTIDRNIRNTMRYRALKVMLEAGIKVNLFGNCAIESFLNYPNLTYHGSVDYRSLLGEVAKSKILINDFKTCKNGSHDRVLNAMLCKTLVLSSQSSFCNGDYKDGESIRFYRHQDISSLTKQVKYYLEYEKKRQAIVEKAYEITSEKHTWANRALEIENLYNILKDYFGL